LDAINPQEIMRILELTDSFNLHRETIIVPLTKGDESSVTILPDHHLRIVVPKNKPFDEWLVELKTHLSSMNLSSVRS